MMTFFIANKNKLLSWVISVTVLINHINIVAAIDASTITNTISKTMTTTMTTGTSTGMSVSANQTPTQTRIEIEIDMETDTETETTLPTSSPSIVIDIDSTDSDITSSGTTTSTSDSDVSSTSTTTSSNKSPNPDVPPNPVSPTSSPLASETSIPTTSAPSTMSAKKSPMSQFEYEKAITQLLKDYKTQYEMKHPQPKNQELGSSSQDGSPIEILSECSRTPPTKATFIQMCFDEFMREDVLKDDKITSIEAANFYEYLCNRFGNRSCEDTNIPFHSLSMPLQLEFFETICPRDGSADICLKRLKETILDGEVVSLTFDNSSESSRDELSKKIRFYCRDIYEKSSEYTCVGTSESPTSSPIRDRRTAPPTLLRNYDTVFSFMVGFDNEVDQGATVNGSRQDIFECITRTIVDVLFEPRYSTLELAAKPQNLKCGARNDPQTVPGNPLRFANTNGNNGIDYLLTEIAVECTEDFIISRYCIIVESEILLESLERLREKDINREIYQSMSQSMDDLQFLQLLKVNDVKEVFYLNDGPYDPAPPRPGGPNTLSVGDVSAISLGSILFIIIVLFICGCCRFTNRYYDDDTTNGDVESTGSASDNFNYGGPSNNFNSGGPSNNFNSGGPSDISCEVYDTLYSRNVNNDGEMTKNSKTKQNDKKKKTKLSKITPITDDVIDGEYGRNDEPIMYGSQPQYDTTEEQSRTNRWPIGEVDSQGDDITMSPSIVDDVSFDPSYGPSEKGTVTDEKVLEDMYSAAYEDSKPVTVTDEKVLEDMYSAAYEDSKSAKSGLGGNYRSLKRSHSRENQSKGDSEGGVSGSGKSSKSDKSSLRDELDKAIETGDWDAFDKHTAKMLEEGQDISAFGEAEKAKDDDGEEGRKVGKTRARRLTNATVGVSSESENDSSMGGSGVIDSVSVKDIEEMAGFDGRKSQSRKKSILRRRQ